jgi:phage-related protein
MFEGGPQLTVRFYRSPAGSEPVRDWIRAQERKVRSAIGRNIRLVQRNWPIGMPLVRALGGGLWEVRTAVLGNAYRVMFTVREGTMYLFHAFVKKTRATPSADLEIARKLYKEGMP